MEIENYSQMNSTCMKLKSDKKLAKSIATIKENEK
jgi:hypothetical protein